MNTEAHCFPRAEKPFPKLDARLQLANGSLPHTDLFRRGCVQQPPRQKAFASPRARDGKILKQRSASKQIQIARVRMLPIEKALSGLAAPGPLIVEPRQSS